MRLFGVTLRPLEELADFAIVAGAAGVVSGYGGRFLFAVPVISYSGSVTSYGTPQWGQSAWVYPATDTVGPNGEYGGNWWWNFWLTLWAESGLDAKYFPAPDFSSSLATWFNNGITARSVPYFGAFGFYGDGTYIDALNDASKTFWGATPGPLGQYAGSIFALVLLGGVVARAGLLGASLASSSSRAVRPPPPLLAPL